MTKLSMSPVVPHDVETCAGSAATGAGWLARPRRRADFRNNGAVEWLFQRPAGHALHGDARLIADERNDGDVSADERLPFIALAENDL